MNAWSYDADLIRIVDDLTSFNLVQNRVVEEFLEVNDRDSKFFIIAPKGVGKTLLIKYKSAKYRREKPAFTFVPALELCEKLAQTDSDISFAQEDLAYFTTTNHWQDIWTICLMSAILKQLGESIPIPLRTIFGNASSIDDFLNALLRDRKFLFQSAKLISTDLSPAIQAVRSPVAVFLDNVDEAMDRHVGSALADNSRKRGRPLGAVSEKVWINSQLGLIEAVKSIHGKNSHIKIFASIRIEAFNTDVSPTHTQTELYCSILKYNDNELRRIFESNIKLMKPADCAKPISTSEIERLLGYGRIDNALVKNTDGKYQSEDVFTYILRHTLRRPRELLLIGMAISQIPVAERTSAKVAQIINEQSTKILAQYQNETVPYWDYTESQAIFHNVNKNVLSVAEVRRLSKKITQESGSEHPFCSFYRKGLIGYLRSENYSHELIQSFLPAAEHIFNQKESLPKSPFYLLHPSLESELRKYHGTSLSLDRRNIVGYDYPFAAIQTHNKTKRRLHVHFGAGKLGLGLVLPVLATNTNVCLIQRPSEKWQQLLNITDDSGNLEIEVRAADKILKLLLVRDPIDERLINSFIQRWKDGAHLMILSEREALLQTLVKMGTSFSTALKSGTAYATNLLNTFQPNSIANVFCFENESQHVEAVREKLQPKGSKYRVLQVVADRICRDLNVSTNPSPRIVVDCESYGRIYVDGRKRSVRNLFKNDNDKCVTFASDENELRFFYEQKYYLMNGIQTVMAFHAYAQLAKRDVPFEKWKDQVLTVETSLPCVTMFSKIQICRIIDRNRAVLANLYPTKDERQLFETLSSYASELASRIDKSPDHIQRILTTDGKSLDEKFDSRCSEIMKFVDDRWLEVEKWEIPALPGKSIVVNELTAFYRDAISVVLKILRASQVERRN
jgi:hypothetical protein